MTPSDEVGREFHIRRAARDRYGLDEALFSLTGNVIFADFRAARELAHRMNEVRDAANHPERAVSAAKLNAMGLVDELIHLVVARYRERTNPGVVAEALKHLEQLLGRDALDRLLLDFTIEFPPLAVYRGEFGAEQYLARETAGESHREIALEELVLVWLANRNPAFTPFRELFDDASIRADSVYVEAMDELRRFLAGQPDVQGTRTGLLDLLEAPMLAAPDSLEDQLRFIRSAWGVVLGPDIDRVLASLDMLTEEAKVFFGFGPGPVEAPRLDLFQGDWEAFSEDRDWMPRLVLLAKNAYVWMAQLSERHGREIATLDAIPDDELDRLQEWGIAGLWLIGVWQRSRASERIKRMMGDADAVASAYSLEDYRIAADLGGDEAFENLKQRAWNRGIRMSTDMVPNHMGIDSRWLIEHPDWFIGLDHSPFPGYSFTGADLCDDERVSVQIEDHYWNRSDAAVVFKRSDRWTGAERYIYHGNDGTTMPWNDTAQLDYRRQDVREAVIQTILHVARRSPIIRFDAAMTLAKQHYHRLWFPEPGTGGDIPSRAGHGMTRAQFDEVMPQEFWREVVDRVAAEAPDTLLLAEAFWLLEGYFVRTLGMHRVYNSAFMNMLRDERNADYRYLIKSTLEYDPRILKRYVNFMSNPDERTAVNQFGGDDKYFGVATLMVTLPGLPMFGHGQIEGLAEKYGMEFRRPRWAEQPNQDLIRRHERQIFPLVRRRGAFAEVDRFRLYDLVRDDGGVDDNVFAYSNGSGDHRSLVVYHNVFGDTRGWIKTSCPVQSNPGGDGSTVHRTELADALELPGADNDFVVLGDAAAGIEFLRSCREIREQGLRLELGAYSLHVFCGLRLVKDTDGRYARLAAELDGRGVPNVAEALAELELAPVLVPFREMVAPDLLEQLVGAPDSDGPDVPGTDLRARMLRAREELLSAIADRTAGGGEESEKVGGRGLPVDLDRALAVDNDALVKPLLDDDPDLVRHWRLAAAAWAMISGLDQGRRGSSDGGSAVVGWMDDWFLARNLRQSILRLGFDEGRAGRLVAAVQTMLLSEGWWRFEGEERPDLRELLDRLLGNATIARFLGVNRHRDVVWFVSESFDEVLACLAVTAGVVEDDPQRREVAAELLRQLAEAKDASGFRLDRLLTSLENRQPK